MPTSLRCFLILAVIVTAADLCRAGEDTGWVRIKLDERFRSEGVAAGDLNNDGTADVVAGDVWYAAPEIDSEGYLNADNWKLGEIRPPGDFVAGKGYSNSFVNAVLDLDQDGWQDVVIIGFPGDPFHWYRNPGQATGHWKEHMIWTSACNESPEFEDLNADGVPEFVMGSQPEAQMGLIPIPDKDQVQQKFNFHAISEPSSEPADKPNRGLDNGTFKYYHGLGVGDVNGDGHQDVMIAHGWWESPGKPLGDSGDNTQPWTFHPIRVVVDGTEQPLPKAANIYADDLDQDGDADLFLSSAHEFGVWWAENKGDGPWTLHTVDDSYSQTHAMEQVDVNGDGQLDYVTGKRFFAHNGGDPGAMDPVVMYWYEVHRQAGQAPSITAHEIVAGRGTGVGTQFQIHDMNQDDKPDIVLSNKKGVNVLIQK